MADQPRTVIYIRPTGPIVKEITETYTPAGMQALIQVEYSGINPADIKHAVIGLHSSVAGYDLSGEVIAVGTDSPFKPGQKIFGHNPAGPARPLYKGAHQDFTIAEGSAWHIVPTERMGMSDAAALPVVTGAAADALFNVLGIGFPAAGIEGANAEGILIWGASGSVGVCTVQLAKAAGLSPIIVTASEKNHGTLKDLGADICFDYKDANVVDKIQKSIRDSGKRVLHIFDAVGSGSTAQGDEFQKSSSATALRCVDQSDKLKLSCVVPVLSDRRWKMCFAARAPPGNSSPFLTDDIEGWTRMQRGIMAWVIQNYKQQFVLPNVRTVQGLQEGLETMKLSAEGKISFEKVVIKHPLVGVS